MPIIPLSDETVAGLLALDTNEFLAACYRILLKRQPDPTGWHDHSEALASGVEKEEIVRRFLGSVEYQLTHGSGQPNVLDSADVRESTELSLRDMLDSVARRVDRRCTNW